MMIEELWKDSLKKPIDPSAGNGWVSCWLAGEQEWHSNPVPVRMLHLTCRAIKSLASAVLIVLVYAQLAHANGNLELSSSYAWLVVGSRENLSDAVLEAERLSPVFPNAFVARSINGRYAIILGWDYKPTLAAAKDRFVASATIPSDAYLSTGARFLEPVWSRSAWHENYDGFVDTSLGITRMRVTLTDEVDEAQGRVTNLPLGEYLSLRVGPSTDTREIERLPRGTIVFVLDEAKGWYRVKATSGNTGWVSGRYLDVTSPLGVIGADHDASVASPSQPIRPPAITENSSSSQTGQASSNAASSRKKVALVIGNGAYQNAPPLINPRNDAEAMSRMLTSIGFEVIMAVDADRMRMEASIRDFLSESKNADLALFFYSGHGMEISGENYLLPVDTKLEDASAINFEVINSSVVTNAMGGQNKVGIVLLDACRDNPLTRSLKRALAGTRAAAFSEGLAPISTDAGGLVVGFATAPGDVAADGDGVNSPFTAALLRWMPKKGLEIEQVMKRVKAEVSTVTKNDQRPWTNSDLTMDVYVAEEK